jgi:hypothetical protein
MGRRLWDLIYFVYGSLLCLLTMHLTSLGAAGRTPNWMLIYASAIFLLVSAAVTGARKSDRRARFFVRAIGMAALGALVLFAAIMAVFVSNNPVTRD